MKYMKGEGNEQKIPILRINSLYLLFLFSC